MMLVNFIAVQFPAGSENQIKKICVKLSLVLDSDLALFFVLATAVLQNTSFVRAHSY